MPLTAVTKILLGRSGLSPRATSALAAEIGGSAAVPGAVFEYMGSDLAIDASKTVQFDDVYALDFGEDTGGLGLEGPGSLVVPAGVYGVTLSYRIVTAPAAGAIAVLFDEIETHESTPGRKTLSGVLALDGSQPQAAFQRVAGAGTDGVVGGDVVLRLVRLGDV